MKKILLMACLSFSSFMSYCQAIDSAKKETVDAKIYLDEHGGKIDEKTFFKLVKGPDYSFHPNIENGKVIALQLKKNEKALKSLSKAPDFSVQDLNGKLYTLSALKGKIVVLNFWFTACIPCIREIPGLNVLTRKYVSNADIVFLAITYDSEEKVRRFLADHPFSYPVSASQKAFIEQYGIVSYPTNIVLDKDGKVTFLLTAYSPGNVKKLDSQINSMIKD